MTQSLTKQSFDVTGKLKRKVYKWTITSTTTLTVVHGIKSVKFSSCIDKTGARASSAIDDTTTAGTTTVTGLTDGDSGYFIVEGK